MHITIIARDWNWLSHSYGVQFGIAGLPFQDPKSSFSTSLRELRIGDRPLIQGGDGGERLGGTRVLLTPNLGLWWYLYALLFEPFLPILKLLGHLHFLLWTLPLIGLWWREQPELLFSFLTTIISIFRLFPVSGRVFDWHTRLLEIDWIDVLGSCCVRGGWTDGW